MSVVACAKGFRFILFYFFLFVSREMQPITFGEISRLARKEGEGGEREKKGKKRREKKKALQTYTQASGTSCILYTHCAQTHPPRHTHKHIYGVYTQMPLSPRFISEQRWLVYRVWCARGEGGKRKEVFKGTQAKRPGCPESISAHLTVRFRPFSCASQSLAPQQVVCFSGHLVPAAAPSSTADLHSIPFDLPFPLALAPHFLLLIATDRHLVLDQLPTSSTTSACCKPSNRDWSIPFSFETTVH